MKELNSIKIIAIDHGCSNIKTANTITPTGITAYDTEPVFTGNILECNGRYYRIGDGHKEFVSDKCMDEDYYLLTMMGIARELHREQLTRADVHLAAGLPLTWVRRQREDFRAYLMKAPAWIFVLMEQITILTLSGAASTHRVIQQLLNILWILKAQTYLQT